MAKVLYFDIETAPNLSYVWGHYEQNVIQHDREWYMLCISYRWEGEKKVHVCALPDFPDAYKKDPENDYHVVKETVGSFRRSRRCNRTQRRQVRY